MRGRLTCGGRLTGFLWRTGTTGKRSPFRARLMISVESAAPEEAVATETSIPMTIETIARSTLQPLVKYLSTRPVDENKSPRSDVCDNMIWFPRYDWAILARGPRSENSDNVPPGSSGGLRVDAWVERDHRTVQDPFGSTISAIKAMRTRSERLPACILIMRLAR